jgi:ribosomal protein S12 methylthiotransferase
VPERYFIETLGCPKNQVDSEKIAGSLLERGLVAAEELEAADVVVVNTCAFIDAAREESVGAIFDAHRQAKKGARLVVTGCLAERYQSELAGLLPEAEVVLLGAAIVPRATEKAPRAASVTKLLEMPRAPAAAPWAYVKVAEGCDRRCGFCAIPSFRGKQVSRAPGAILNEIASLGAQEVILVAQDLGSYGRDLDGRVGLVDLVGDAATLVKRVRLLYLYPAALNDALIDAVLATDVPYFDLSLQHVSGALLRRMRRYGNGERFLARIGDIRAKAPNAAFRSSFIIGYPGETEADHDELLAFLGSAQLDWAGFFAFSDELGTYAHDLDDKVPRGLMMERLREVTDLQDEITARRRASLVGSEAEVMIDAPGIARSHREAPEIDGVIKVPRRLPVGAFCRVTITAAEGPDLVATDGRDASFATAGVMSRSRP